MIYLETDRMSLREMEPTEASLLFDLDSDPEVMKFLSGGKTTDLETCEKSIHSIRGYYEKHDHKFGLWFAEEKVTGKFIGWFLLRPDKKKSEDIKNPELGYRLKKQFWGQGYATEGSLELIKKAFLEFECDSVFAITMRANVASQNVMKKVGMSFIADFEEDQCVGPNGEKAAVHYAITKSQWLKNQK